MDKQKLKKFTGEMRITALPLATIQAEAKNFTVMQGRLILNVDMVLKPISKYSLHSPSACCIVLRIEFELDTHFKLSYIHMSIYDKSITLPSMGCKTPGPFE